MKNKIEIGVNVETGKPVTIDLNNIVEDRALMTANSRGGKSYLVRKFLEESNNKIQQIVIDPEGEYKTLREKFDYLLIGSKDEGAEIQISVKIASILPVKLLELGVSAIIDLYELRPDERIRFVRIFLESMINVRKELWSPCLVILDEAHVYAPEKGQGRDAESLNAVKDLASRGGKRNFALVACTQRLAKLSKDVTTELNNKFIGRAGDYDDQMRAKKELGLKSIDESLFGSLKHEFFARGNAISDEVIRIKAGEVKTTHALKGKQLRVVIPTPEKIKSIALSLKDIPEEAEKDLKSKEQMEKTIIELSNTINTMRRTQVPQIDKNRLEQERKLSYSKGYEESEKFWKAELDRLQILHDRLLKSSEDIVNQRNLLVTILKQISTSNTEFVTKLKEITKLCPNIKEIQIDNFQFRMKQKPQPIELTSTPNKIVQPVSNVKMEVQGIGLDGTKLRQGAMKMLKAVAMYHPKEVTKNQVATIAGFSVGGGTFNTYLSELKQLGWIMQQGEMISITNEGLEHAGEVQPLPTDPDSLIDMWCTKFRGGAAKMLREITSWYPNEISKEDLGEKTGFATGGGTFNTYLSELRSNGLIEISGNMIKATAELFPMVIS